VHPSTIYRLLKRKRIPAFKVGSDWRFDRGGIERWRLAQQTREE
jgi:excisionase family DNA binding protein